MQKLLYIAAAMLCGVAAEASAADLSIFSLSDDTGHIWNFPTQGLTMTPVGDSLVVTSADVSTVSLDLFHLSKGGFSSDNLSGIHSLLFPSDACTVYSISGVYAGSFHSVSEAKAALPAGVYILHTPSATHKLILK